MMIKNEQSFDAYRHGIFALIIGLILPVILIPIIKITGYSEILEEISKALVVLFVILKIPTFKAKLLMGIGFGFLFGLSENFLYLNQIFQLGEMDIFLKRFLWTVPMHILTVLVMLLAGVAQKWLIVFGLFGAIIIHVLFNSIAVELLIK